MVADFRRAQSGYSLLFIDGYSVEIVKSTKFLDPTPNAAAPESQEVIMLLRQNSYCFRKRSEVRLLSYSRPVSPVYSVDSSVQQRAASLLNPAGYCYSGPVLSDWRSLRYTSLLRNKPKSLAWNPAAAQAFDKLKTAFTTAPLLVHPNPEFPFIVEVNASTTGVGAVLSQQQGNPRKLHPCAFFSRKLSPAEVSYDIGNRELLAIKLTLEDLRHWLEGAKHAFVVLTDHKKLEYLRAAKRLNPRQARWALFFTRFHFTISYRPGSKNIKVAALSCIHSRDETSEEPESILPEKLFASAISWLEETLP
ncbi:hypothetical protein QTP70_000217 [Hemibagrus guttatus]|uniref:Reverse transcriptase/retrotransposon-derived protein RNase H-like domain-containing protein n=1 Tax=Hemibagrus guttatus TaxID=175788 RepID=A0AAE0PT76_9TELE|nr:hypothetical protein QTP70_000217 [Hemibagrus guttatus]